MEWYYASNGQQMGPVSQEELISLFDRGEIKASDLVWNEGMPDWVAFSSVPELRSPTVSTDPGGAEMPPSMPQEPAVLTPATGGPAIAGAAGTEKVPTYLWQSIVCLVLCCLPAAIPALVFATKVEPALKSGDVAAAKEASSKAKMWCWIAFGVGIVVNIIAFLVGIAGALAEQA
ncbi:MAG: CD225/dispanin family protein [Verrucomicrobiales bacterium]|nr:CD225/dispanin family protein [Verrucomicrobiales bacterium]